MTEKIELTGEDAKKLIDETLQKIFDLLDNSTSHVSDKQRFLILGRISAFIFHCYFNPVVTIARKEILCEKV